jgi:hypothetical protein
MYSRLDGSTCLDSQIDNGVLNRAGINLWGNKRDKLQIRKAVLVRILTGAIYAQGDHLCSILLVVGPVSFEERQINRLRHPPVACFTRMEMIARIIGRQQVQWICRIANGSIEINDSIKTTTGSNPFVDRLPR